MRDFEKKSPKKVSKKSLQKKSPKKGTLRTDRNFPKGAFFWRLFFIGAFFLRLFFGIFCKKTLFLYILTF